MGYWVVASVRHHGARIMDARNDFCLHQSIRDALGVKRENVMREGVKA